MSCFLIAKKDTNELETIVFSGEGGEVVAVFTDPERARQYIEDAGWANEFVPAKLEPIDFMEWLMKCHRDGIRFMATDPDRADHESGQRVSTIEIEAQLRNAAHHIELVASPDF